MKNLKKVLATVITLVMVLSLGATAHAATYSTKRASYGVSYSDVYTDDYSKPTDYWRAINFIGSLDGLGSLAKNGEKIYPYNIITHREFSTILIRLYGTKQTDGSYVVGKLAYVIDLDDLTDTQCTQQYICDKIVEVSQALGTEMSWKTIPNPNWTVSRGNACNILWLFITYNDVYYPVQN